MNCSVMFYYIFVVVVVNAFFIYESKVGSVIYIFKNINNFSNIIPNLVVFNLFYIYYFIYDFTKSMWLPPSLVYIEFINETY